MSDRLIIHEKSVFTSSGLGGTGYTKSIKKNETFNFTPSPNKNHLNDGNYVSNLNDNDTYDYTKLDELYSKSWKETYFNKNLEIDNCELITNFYENVSEKFDNDNLNTCFNNKKKNKLKRKNSISTTGMIESSQDICILNLYIYILYFTILL